MAVGVWKNGPDGRNALEMNLFLHLQAWTFNVMNGVKLLPRDSDAMLEPHVALESSIRSWGVVRDRRWWGRYASFSVT